MKEQIHEFIESLNKKINLHEGRVKTLLQCRYALQNICKHEFETEGHDHNNTYEKCTVCGITRKTI